MPDPARKEPVWPLLVVLGLVVGGVALGSVLTGDTPAQDPVRSLEAGAESGLEIPAPRDRVRVEVLNAGGITGAAAAAKDRLRDAGFDVVYYGNAPSFDREASVVLIRTGEDEAAHAVGGSLGVPLIQAEPDTTLLVDVTVLLGREWGTGEGATLPEEGPGDRPWWDPRRLMGPTDG